MMAALPVKGLRPPTFNEYAHVTRNYDFENAVCNGPSLGALGEPRVSRRVKNKMEQDVASIVGSDDRRHRTSACPLLVPGAPCLAPGSTLSTSTSSARRACHSHACQPSHKAKVEILTTSAQYRVQEQEEHGQLRAHKGLRGAAHSRAQRTAAHHSARRPSSSRMAGHYTWALPTHRPKTTDQ